MAIDKRMKPLCPGHPVVDGVPWERDWDIVYDPELTAQFEKQYGIPTPVEVVLYHEIFGHVLPLLRDPGPLKKHPKVDEHFKKVNECEALDLENRFRRRIGAREVPPKLVGCPSP